MHRPQQSAHPPASGPATASQNAFPALGPDFRDAGHTPRTFPEAGTPATIRRPTGSQSDLVRQRHLPPVFGELRTSTRLRQIVANGLFDKIQIIIVVPNYYLFYRIPIFITIL